jgi:hypothetical protein
MYEVASNSTGWIDLFNGHPVSAAYNMYLGAFGGPIFICILLIVFQIMVVMKTRNLQYSFVLGLIFMAMVGGAQYMLDWGIPLLTNSIFIVMTLELVGMLYWWFFT